MQVCVFRDIQILNVRQVNARQIDSYTQKAQQVNRDLLDVQLLQGLVLDYGNNVRVKVVLVKVVVNVLVIPDNHVDII